jgi:uncharacterized cupredoxin-like copper-binding protein
LTEANLSGVECEKRISPVEAVGIKVAHSRPVTIMPSKISPKNGQLVLFQSKNKGEASSDFL